MKKIDATIQSEYTDATTRPLTGIDSNRILALNHSTWPVELFNEIEIGKHGSGEKHAQDRFFGTHVREALKILR